MGVVPHAHQPKESKYPKTRKLTFPDENVQFFVLGMLQNISLIAMCLYPYRFVNYGTMTISYS
ncbi:hypothetical protein CON71_04400 [Bacillus thuringiensis]|uniref:Uncharacterized protein n=1 Tax=Bacillus thuringiensis TaxID=1428 RepID=A0A9X6TSH0_BACTU|nr:hypothetical protein CON71_04400 [Bacillus thuringiensis]